MPLNLATLLCLTLGLGHFPILGKSFHHFHLIILRAIPQNNTPTTPITNIRRIVKQQYFHKTVCKNLELWPILTLSRPMSLSHTNQSIDLHNKSMDWFLYDRKIRHEKVKQFLMMRCKFCLKQNLIKSQFLC